MSDSTKKSISTILIVTISCMVMAYVEMQLVTEYYLKSIIKSCFFLILPIAYMLIFKVSFKELFKINKRNLFIALLLGVAVYTLILLGYFLISTVFDFSNITKTLQRSNINASNFIYVALYISFINSLLEEFFFRGFAFLQFKKYVNKWFAYIFSSLAFAIYHVGIMIDWFDPTLFLLLLVGLFISGAFFNFINERHGNIYNSWLVHMFANFSINTVGLILFGIL